MSRISVRSIGFIGALEASDDFWRHAVGPGQRLDRVKSLAVVFGKNAPSRERAIRHDERRLARGDRARELLRVAAPHLVVLSFHAPRAVDGRALFHHLDVRVGNHPENPRARITNLLGTKMASGVIRDAPEPAGELAR